MSLNDPTATSCCPPGSHEAPPPLPLTGDQQPKGTFFKLGGDNTDDGESLPCYYTAPLASTTLSTPAKAILVYTDVWGFQSRLPQICDYLAEHGGFHVLAPDCFRGQTKADHVNDFVPWLQQTPPATVARDTQWCLDYLKEKMGVTAIDDIHLATIGFCWGCWAIAHSFDDNNTTTSSPKWKAAVGLHPSFVVEKLAFGGNDAQLMQQITCPVLFLAAGNDAAYCKPDSQELQAMPNATATLFPDMVHGWTTRGDVRADPKIERDVQRALQETLGFLQEHLNTSDDEQTCG